MFLLVTDPEAWTRAKVPQESRGRSSDSSVLLLACGAATLTSLICRFSSGLCRVVTTWLRSPGPDVHKTRLPSSIKNEPELKSEHEHKTQYPSPPQRVQSIPLARKCIQSTCSSKSWSLIHLVIQLLLETFCLPGSVSGTGYGQKLMGQIARGPQNDVALHEGLSAVRGR